MKATMTFNGLIVEFEEIYHHTIHKLRQKQNFEKHSTKT